MKTRAGRGLTLLILVALVSGCAGINGTSGDESRAVAVPSSEGIRIDDTPEERRLREELIKPVSVTFDGTPFLEAIDRLRALSGVNIVVDQTSLAAEGITKDTKIKLKVKNVPLKSVLNLVLEQVNLAYDIRHGVVFIANNDGLVSGGLETRVYNVRDLVAYAARGWSQRKARERRDDDGGDWGNAWSGNGDNGFEWGNGGNWGDDDGDTDDDALGNGWGSDSGWNDDVAWDRPIEAVVALIQGLAAPEVEEGGSATIETLRDEMLVVRQTSKAHDEIEVVLSRFRELLALQAKPRTRKRVFRVAIKPPESIYVKRIHEQLAKPMSLTLQDVQFEKAVEIFGEQAGINIVVDQKALLKEDIGPDTATRVEIENRPAEDVLDLILEHVNLTYTLREDVVFVGGPLICGGGLVTHADGVRDLAAPAGGDSAEIKDLELAVLAVTAPRGFSSSTDNTSIESFGNGVLIVCHRPGIHDQLWDFLSTLSLALTPPEPGEAMNRRVWGVPARDSSAEERIRKALERRVTLDFPGTKFENVIKFLKDLSGVNIVVDQRSLVAEGIGKDTLIEFKAKGIRLADALTLILEQVNLTYAIRNEAIHVSNGDSVFMGGYVPRIYDVRDLATPLERGPEEASQDDRDADRCCEGTPGPLDEVTTLIEGVVAPDTWETSPEGAGSIESFRDQLLLIWQRPRAHDEIADLLRSLRQAMSAPREGVTE